MVIMLMVMIPAMRAEDFSAKDVVLEHIKDSHDWHITDIKTSDGELEPVAIPLPVIAKVLLDSPLLQKESMQAK